MPCSQESYPEEIMTSAHSVRSNYHPGGPQPIKEALLELADDFAQRKKASGPNKLVGIATGFSDLDSCISGIRPGSLVVIASRPSVGKTTLAMNIASYVAVNNKLPVLMFSMDISAIAMASRLVSHVGKIEVRNLRTGNLNEPDENDFYAAVSKLSDMPLVIDETNALTVEEIAVRTYHVFRQWNGLSLIVIDHLQLIEPIDSGNGAPANYEEVMVRALVSSI